ncbi:MAG: cytochrome P450 [Pseudomonadota bacterium]
MARDTSDARPIPVTVPAPPGPQGMWRAWRAARQNLLSIIPEPCFHEPVLSGGRRIGWLMLQDPEGLEQVLKKREAIYPRSDVTLRILRPREGESLFTAPQATWKWQHKAMAPIFQHRHLVGMAPMMAAAAQATADRMDAAGAGKGAVVDVYPEMVQATADVICDAALSGRESLDREALTNGVSAFIENVARISLLDILGAPAWVPRPGRLLDRSGKQMDARMDAIIAARQARGPSDPPDLLDLLIGARDADSGRAMSAVELRNNLLAFIVAGHETTALALTWSLYLLAFDPAAQARAAEEAGNALGERMALAEDLPQMSYVRQVIDEAMRLYPPAGLLTKTAKGEDEILGHKVVPGMIIMIPIWALHRHRRLWDNPDAFDPDRFAPEAKAARHRYAYLPFSAGPRICLGMQFALMEAHIILASLIARYRFELPEGFVPDPKMIFTLRPGDGMPLVVTRR